MCLGVECAWGVLGLQNGFLVCACAAASFASFGKWGSWNIHILRPQTAIGLSLGGSPNFDLIRVRFAHPPSPAQGTQAFLRKARWLDICRMHPLRPQRKLRVWNEPSPMQGTQSCLRHDRWDVLTIHRPKRSGELSKHRMRSKFPRAPEAETKRHPPCRSVRGNPASAPVCAPFKKQSEGVSQ